MTKPWKNKSKKRDFTAQEKFDGISREVMLCKRTMLRMDKKGKQVTDASLRRLDLLRAVARDYRALAGVSRWGSASTRDIRP